MGVDLSAPGFTPQLLLRLVRVAYHHVQISDDVQHEGGRMLDVRDHAERGRGATVWRPDFVSGTRGEPRTAH